MDIKEYHATVTILFNAMMQCGGVGKVENEGLDVVTCVKGRRENNVRLHFLTGMRFD